MLRRTCVYICLQKHSTITNTAYQESWYTFSRLKLNTLLEQ